MNTRYVLGVVFTFFLWAVIIYVITQVVPTIWAPFIALPLVILYVLYFTMREKRTGKSQSFFIGNVYHAMRSPLVTIPIIVSIGLILLQLLKEFLKP